MDQYRPCGEARNLPEIAGPLGPGEHEAALDEARRAGLTRLDDCSERLVWRLLRDLER